MPLTLGDPTVPPLAPPPAAAPPPPATPPPGPSGGGSPPPYTPSPTTTVVPGNNPDYGALVTSDPNYIAGSGDLSAQGLRDAAARDAGIRTALINGGFDINDPSFDPKLLDPATLAAIKANRFSTAARLATQKGRADADLKANLAARGIIYSGGLTGGLQRDQDNYEGAVHDAISQLLAQITGYNTNFASSQDARAAQLRQLREDAAGRIQNDPRYQSTADQTATLDPASGYYKTPDGRWYDVNGKPVADPSSGSGVAQGVVPIDQFQQQVDTANHKSNDLFGF